MSDHEGIEPQSFCEIDAVPPHSVAAKVFCTIAIARRTTGRGEFLGAGFTAEQCQ